MSKPVDLLPELRNWNDGRGISPLDYLFCFARSDIAIAYIDLFWPEFVVFEEYVFRAGFDEDHVRSWQQVEKITRRNVEAAVNYIDISDLFKNSSEERSDLLHAREELMRSTLAEIYAAKLRRDFPDRSFEVSLDGDDEELALTFYQT